MAKNNNPYFAKPKAAPFAAPGQKQLQKEEEKRKSTAGNGGATLPAKDVPGSAFAPRKSTDGQEVYGPHPLRKPERFDFRRSNAAQAQKEKRRNDFASGKLSGADRIIAAAEFSVEEQKKKTPGTREFIEATIKKYGIDPKTFDAQEHFTLLNRVAKEDGVDAFRLYGTDGSYNYSGFSKERANEMEFLEILAANNNRKKSSTTDYGAAVTGGVGAVDALSFGFLDDVGDHYMRKEYERAGLPMGDYAPANTETVMRKSIEEHPVAYTVGETAGIAAQMALTAGLSAPANVGGGIQGARTAFNAAQAANLFGRAAVNYVPKVYAGARTVTNLVTLSGARKAASAFDSSKSDTEFNEMRAKSTKKAAADNNFAGIALYGMNTLQNMLDSPAQVADVASAYINAVAAGDDSAFDELSSNWNAMARTQAARSGIMEDKSGIGAFAWEVGLGIGDNIIRNVIGGQGASMALLATTAFPAAVQQSYEQSGDIYAAVANGFVQTAFEYITEQVPTDKFWEAVNNPTMRKALLKNVLLGMGLEGGGEALNALVSNAAEVGILGKNSGFMLTMSGLQQMYMEQGASEAQARDRALREAFMDFFVKQPLLALGQGALSGGIMQGLANGIGALKKGAGKVASYRVNKRAAAAEAQEYMLTPVQKEFDDLSPEAQAIVRKEFADRPQELQSFIQRKSPTGSISKDAQKIIDDATDVIYGKKKSILNGVDVKVSATMPSDTVITADTNGVVAVDTAFTPDVANVTDVLSKRTGLKFGYAEYYQNGKRNNAYNGHYDPTTKTIYFRKGASEEEIIYKTAVHELTHFAESSKHYAYVSDFVLNKKFEGVDSDAYKKAVKDKIAAYAKNGIELTPEEARRELVAENIREVIFETEKHVDNLVRTDYTFAQRILDIIDSFIYHFNNTFGRFKGDAKILADLEQARRKYRLALASAKGMRGASNGGISFTIKTADRIGTVAFLDGLKVKRKKGESIQSAIRRDFKDRFMDCMVRVNDIGNDVTLDQIGKYLYPGERQEGYDKKIRVYPVLDEMLRIATGIDWNKNLLDSEGNVKSHGGLDCTGGFNYYSTQFAVDSSGIIYGGTIICRIDKHGREYFYDLNKIETVGYKNESEFKPLYSFISPKTVSSNNSIPHPDPTVKNQMSFSSSKSDTEESIFDADVPMRHIDGSVRTYAEYQAEQDAAAQAAEAEVAQQTAEQDFTPAPGVEKSPTDNADVAAIVNADGNKRTDDIELQYSQRLKGKNSMLFKDISRVLDYVCDKMPGVRDFWRNRIEKQFWRAKASFTSRSRQYLTELKTTAEELGIRIGSKESAAAQWYGEGYRTVWQENPSYEKGNGQPKKVAVREAYTLADLKRDFPESWENIVKFDEYARGVYDRYLAELNTMLVKVYPNLELQLEAEITDLRRSIDDLRERPERVQADIDVLQEDINALEAQLADLQQRRDSGADIAGALDAIEQKRVKKETELAALKNKGTKKAALLEKQAATAGDKAERLRQSDRESLDKAIRTVEERLENKRAALERLQLQVSDDALELYHRQIDEKEAEIRKKRQEIDNGEAFRGKRLIPRKDYYHHFQEMSEGFAGLVNILIESDEIDPRLVGVSENTKPKSAWEGFMQRQGLGAYDADALGGLNKYIQAAEYKLAFDPIISDMRSVIKTLAEDTSQTRNANGFILYLTRWTDGLARKTNFLDRGLQELTRRKLTKVIQFLNGRTKSNTLVGSFRNAVAQFMNIPNGFLYIQDMQAWGAGVKNALFSLKKNSQAKKTMAQSAFLNERYISDVVDSFKRIPLKEILGSLKKGAIAMMNFGDKFTSNIIWNAAYAQGNNQGLSGEELIMYADDITRRCVAGRGIGELAPVMESKWLQTFAPFQIEPNNTWNSLLQVIQSKGGKKIENRLRSLLMFEGASWALNQLASSLGIGQMLPSMLYALSDVFHIWNEDDEEEEEELSFDQKLWQTGVSVINEVLSWLPFSSNVLPILFGYDEIEGLLGKDNTITRYGGGNMGLSGITSFAKKIKDKDVEGAALDLVTGYLLRWGGGQVKKFYEAAKDFGGFNESGESASYTPDGRLRFPMEKHWWNISKGTAFGKYATKEGKEYIDTGRAPYSEERTEAFNAIVATGADPNVVYDTINEASKLPKAEQKRRFIMDTPGLTAEQKSMLDNAFFKPRENPVDYSSEDNFIITSEFPDASTQRKAFGLLDSGMSAKDAVNKVEYINSIKGDKDETGNTIKGSETLKKLRYVHNLDIPDEQKGALYRYCMVESDNKRMVLARANGLSDAALGRAYAYLSLVEGTKGANGKSIKGSHNRNINRVLSQIPGLTEADKDGLRVMFMTDSETRDYYTEKLLNKMLSGNRLTPEWKKEFAAWYYNDDKRVDTDALFRVLDGEKDVPVSRITLSPTEPPEKKSIPKLF